MHSRWHTIFYLLQLTLTCGTCWGNGPVHVGVNESLYELEGLFVNTVSARGAEENNQQELGAKFPTTPVPRTYI
jgi:hypothetical protein